jgi:TetR/AcrR family transcriptional regulator, transcriptional repressor for nem operon
MPKPSHRDSIISAGLQTMFRKGYVGASVRDIVASAGVPQGSFTNHFASKEAFAGEVLDTYFDHVRSLVRHAFEDASLSPRERLVHYLDVITDRLKADGYARGCLIGDFSIEAPGHSEALREQLLAIYREWSALFAACIREAQAAGEIPTAHQPEALADFLLTCWEGAILRAKVERGRAPLDRFRRIAFSTVFKEEK